MSGMLGVVYVVGRGPLTRLHVWVRGSSQARYLCIHQISEMYGAGIFVVVTVLIPSITDYYST